MCFHLPFDGPQYLANLTIPRKYTVLFIGSTRHPHSFASFTDNFRELLRLRPEGRQPPPENSRDLSQRRERLHMEPTGWDEGTQKD